MRLSMARSMDLAGYAGMDFAATEPAVQDIGGPAQPLLLARGLVLHQKDAVVDDDPLHDAALHQPRLIDDLSLHVAKGETVAVVGEAGSGKTLLTRLIARLQRPDAGELIFDGLGVDQFAGLPLKHYWRELQMVVADTPGTLNPRWPVLDSVAYGLRAQGLGDARARQRAAATLTRVGLVPQLHGPCRPHELSAAQRLRVGIARALVLEPRLLLLDDALAGLDNAMRGSLLNLLQQLRTERALALLLLTRDPRLATRLADRVLVMHRGVIVESAPPQALLATPRHPHTRALLAAAGLRPATVDDAWPPLAQPTSRGGCSYRGRCAQARQVCELRVPMLRASAADHQAACHFDPAMTVAQPAPR